jgi:ketosteroid isomerase-like protein
MDGEVGAGTLTAVPNVAGSRAGLQKERAEERAAKPEAERERGTTRAAARGATEAPVGKRTRSTVAGSPQSKEEIVACLFEAFSRRDFLSVLPLLHPDVVFQPMTAEVTRAGEPYRGHEGIRTYTEDVAAQWEELTLHPAQIRAAGRAVVVLGLVSGSGPAGSFKDAPTTWVIKFKGGLVYGVQIFSDARHVVGALRGDEQG